MRGPNGEKIAYICGPLTELGEKEGKIAKWLYEQTADLTLEILGARAFVPHEHCDPISHAYLSPTEVEEKERRQIKQDTSLLIVFPLAPSWGGGIEVEMANRYNVLAWLVPPKSKRISRLLWGNPAIELAISYRDEAEAVDLIRRHLEENKTRLMARALIA